MRCPGLVDQVGCHRLERAKEECSKPLPAAEICMKGKKGGKGERIKERHARDKRSGLADAV